MPPRKWLVRGLVLLVVAGVAGAGLLYQRWTNPDAVRQQVLDHLSRHFSGANATLESARLRLLGGIELSELRMSRRDDADRTDFLYVPAVVVYHDKEKLFDGELSIRKVELQRPRIRVIRGWDGGWNLSGILGPVNLNQSIPTIVIQQGTVIVQDRQAAVGTPPFEIKDVNLTLINDPRPTVVFEGTALSETAGPLQVSGRWQRETGDTVATIDAPKIPVGPAIVQRLASYCPEVAEHARQLSGTVKLKADLSYRAAATPSLSHDVRLQISQGKLRHHYLPIPLEYLEGSLRMVNGRITDAKATALSDRTRIELKIRDLSTCLPGKEGGNETANCLPAASPCPQLSEDVLAGIVKELDLKIEHMQITPELFTRLPDSLQKMQQDLQQLQREFSPTGQATVTFSFRSESAGDWSKTIVVQPEQASAEYEDFRYRLERITGTIRQESGAMKERLVKVDLVGYAGKQPVYVRGEVKGEKEKAAVNIDIWGHDILLEDRLLAALPKKYQDLARSFKPAGKANFKALIRRTPSPASAGMAKAGQQQAVSEAKSDHGQFHNQYTIAFHHATLCYNEFPYPLEDVSGVLDIQPDHWEVRDFRGFHKQGEFRIRARSHSGSASDRDEVSLEIKGADVLLDDELARALNPDLQKTWNLFAPTGRIDLHAKIRCPARKAAGTEPDIDLTIYPRGCSIRPEFFRWRLEGMYGCIRYHRNWVKLENMRARRGHSNVGLEEGSIYCRPGIGGVWAELNGLWGNPVLPEEDFLSALPGQNSGLQKAWRTLELKDPITFKTTLVINTLPEAKPDIYWDGWVGLHDASIRVGIPVKHITGQVACRGRHNGQQLEGVVGNLMLKQAVIFNQPLQDIHGQFEVNKDMPDILRVRSLQARYFGGEIYGPLRIEFGPTVRYEMRLSASQVKLEEFGRHNFSSAVQMSGEAAANLHLIGDGPDLHGLRGNGSVDVPKGKMYNLPLLLDLIKVLGLRPPDRTAFEEAHVRFSIQGPRARVTQLDLIGNAISLRGEGETNLDGSDLNLDFHVDWARAAQLWPQLIKEPAQKLSNTLLKLEMRGSIGKVKIKKIPVPLVVKPVQNLLGRE